MGKGANILFKVPYPGHNAGCYVLIQHHSLRVLSVKPKKKKKKINNTVGAASQRYRDELMVLKCELMLSKCELMLLKCELMLLKPKINPRNPLTLF